MAPDLSVAIIFKNDVRCIERCLKSLLPLKEELSCEIIMADTGSADGSRAVAERYADAVFDFEWVNDFSAARNAVFERCSGRWALVIDSDEWLDGDVRALTAFLKDPRTERYAAGAMTCRNYVTKELDRCTQARVTRVFRMSAKPRYVGAIHEAVIFDTPGGQEAQLIQAALHHDGYVVLNDGSEAGREKRTRNMTLLREEAERNPENLRTLMLWLNSGEEEPDFRETAQYAVRLVEEKKPYYKEFGPGILRAAVHGAAKLDLPEAEQWAATAERLFPDSLLTRIDIALQMMVRAWSREDWDECLRLGEIYLRACRRFRAGKADAAQPLYASLNYAAEFREWNARILLADAYRKKGNGNRAYAKLRELPADKLNAKQMRNALRIAAALYKELGTETELLIRGLWNAACGDETDEQVKERKQAFLDMGRTLLADARTGGRAGWEIFLPLAGDCPLGDAAALLRCESPEEADAILARVGDASELPGTAKEVHAMAPDLSVAIIFKNDERCIERCLKSLLPLKGEVSCEIIMADTGSADGSRAVAERYADAVFDFEWVNDFSAARNAVFERCSGRWALVIDSDEWLDGDVRALTAFLKDPRMERYAEGAVTRCDYLTKELDRYAQVCIPRVFRMSAKPRYVGAIHEVVVYDAPGGQTVRLIEATLHHDGYIELNDGSEAGKEKRVRNMALLREEAERNPEDLRTLMQWLESGWEESDLYEKARYAVRLVEEKKPRYEDFGPGIMRIAVKHAAGLKWPEAEEWTATAERMFPNAPSTQIDIQLIMAVRAQKRGEWDECIRRGETYLRAYRRFRSDKRNASSLCYTVLSFADDSTEWSVCFLLAEAYRKKGNGKRAYDKLRELPADELGAQQTASALKAAADLFEELGIETELLIRGLWSAARGGGTSEKAKERKQAFLDMGRALFTDTRTGGRAGWEIFLPLAGECPLGDAAALLRCESPEEADAILARVGDASELPGTAVAHAMKLGAAFPVPDKPLTVEQADLLAVRLAVDRPFLREAAMFAASAAEDDADVIWARALALAAMQEVDWKTDEAAGPLLRSFVRIESTFLARCYSEHALRSPEYLPPLYRFALHLANAFSILDAGVVSPEFTPAVSGGVRGALAELKAAAFAAPEHKAAVDWVLDDILRTNQ